MNKIDNVNVDKNNDNDHMPLLQYTADGKYVLTIRKAIVEAHGWKEGDQLELSAVRCPGHLVLEKIR